MRKLDRTKIKVPDALDDLNGSGATETEAMIIYYSKKKPTGKAPCYNAYKSTEVKNALSDLSNNKCSYCESKVRAVDDGDIEHFRPKGEIKDKTITAIKPGYYWLGANWDNLFLSCAHCNQERKRPAPNGQIMSTGKKNQFPLLDESKRIRTPKRNIAEEEPYRLLLNPCLEDPMNHIIFDDQGIISAVIIGNNKPDPKGETSIWVFALYRKELTEARREYASSIFAALKSYEDIEREFKFELNNPIPEIIQLKEKLLSKNIENLREFTKESKEYSAMAINIITNFLARRGIVFKP